MPQSLTKLMVHIIFSTKKRRPLIHPPVEENLHKYIGGICNKLGCKPIKIGGYTDHIHIFCNLSKKIKLIDLIQQVKQSSSAWIKTQDSKLKDFSWQDGYSAFSVYYEDAPKLIAYIENQKAHHQTQSFEEELKQLLIENEIEFDERFLFED